MFMNAWWPALSATRVLARLSDPQLTARVAKDLDGDERRALSDSYAWLRGSEGDADEVSGWSVADIALLDELVSILGPMPRTPTRSSTSSSRAATSRRC